MKNLLILICLLAFFSCEQQQAKKSSNKESSSKSKLLENDPFAKTTVESEFFEISTDSDTIIEGKNGTIIQIPREAFVDENGKPISGKVKIELAEPESLDEYLLSGITSQSGDKLLESKGTFYINATQDGKPLFINPDKPIYIEKPIAGKKNGDIKIFNGTKKANGEIEWKEAEAIEKFLIAVDLELLDFLPKDFAKTVEENMPYRKYQEATKELIDSFYYSFEYEKLQVPLLQVYTRDEITEMMDTLLTEVADSISSSICGIRPASIKALKSKKFNQSIIATREFEKRLKSIFKSCNNELLQLYVKNADKNLWEIDAMAADLLGPNHAEYETFQAYSAEKLTKVKKSKSADELSAYYQKQLKRIQKDLKLLKDKAEQDLKEKREVAETSRQEYHQLLREREKYRMNKFGFELTSMGWKKGAIYVEDLEKFVLEVNVNQGDQFDRVHTYVMNDRIRSLFAMESDNQVHFNRGYNMDKHLLMNQRGKANVFVIAYKGDQAYFGKQEFTADTETPAYLNFDLEPISYGNLRYQLRTNYWKKYENNILVDLKYQAKFAAEKKRQQRLVNERTLVAKLEKKAFACCQEEMNGKALFQSHCASCHTPHFNQLVGPGLAGATSKYDLEWLIAFTQNSQKLVEEGDEIAIRLTEEYNKVLMPAQALNHEEIIAIFEYIDGLGHPDGN